MDKLGVVIVGAVIVALAVAICGACGDLFFTLDDPYIHLAVAENLVQHGVYGVNPDAISAPSSSFLWPFLIVPFEAIGQGPYGVFAFNVLCAAASVWLATRILSSVSARWAWLLALLWGLGTNVVGLVFTGMEHSLQMLCAVLVAYGVFRILQDAATPRWLWLVLIIAPWVRYELLAVTAPVIVWRFAAGARRPAVITLGLSLLGLASFSAVLLAWGLDPLPSSVMAKERVSSVGLLSSLLQNIDTNGGGIVLFAAATLAALGYGWHTRWTTDRANAIVAMCGVMTCVLHLSFGQTGWFNRYEAYAVGFAFLLVAVVLPPAKERAHVVALATGLLVLGHLYIMELALIPAAAGNVHAQQYQMHRLVKALDGPVGCNDLGWVSYRNDREVFDFYGLGNREALAHRRSGDMGEWMSAVAAERGLELILVYPGWYPDIPDEWTEVGRLCLEMTWVTVGDYEVQLLAPGIPSAELLQTVEQWSATLPASASFSTQGCAEAPRHRRF